MLGHMGEMLPFMFSRANFTLGAAKTEGASLPDTYARNVWVTTSGFFNLEPFKVVLGVTARDRIMVRLFFLLLLLLLPYRLCRERIMGPSIMPCTFFGRES